ncbi:MAG: GTPase HflX [Phycisphaerales bacterium]
MSQVQRDQLRVVAEKAVLVAVQLPGRYFDSLDPLGELRALAETAGAVVVGELLQKRDKPSGRTYLGKGKAVELAQLVAVTGATLVIFDNDLTPAQIRAVEAGTECKVIDRSELILDIFANRAATHAAKLQVEIAQLEYTYPRLRAMWTHLENIVGGAPIGIGTRGPGEKQLEIDRRLVQLRLRNLKRELVRIQQRKSREVQRRNLDHYTVGLVGYTNAGKSTLFNGLTSGGAFVHEKLFATLGTRIERWDLGGGNSAMLSDTVGFIRQLPHHLVASFRSTLEETIFANLIIIVLDVADPNAQMQLGTVRATLDEIGAADQQRILTLNKIDRLTDSKTLLCWLNQEPEAIPLSATTGEGLDELADAVREHMIGGVREVTITVSMADSRAIDFIEKRTEVLDRQYGDGQAQFTVRIGRRQVDQLLARSARIRINDQEPLEAVETEWGGR